MDLADHFDQVIATDASKEQLAHAPVHPQVKFRHASAEASGFPDASVDLVTVAAALHWFDLERFYQEVRRVVRPNGVIAAWSYGAAVRIDPEIDPRVDQFAKVTLGPYWAPDFVRVQSRYRQLRFPFEPLPSPHPPLCAGAQWDLDAFISHVKTWSGLVHYVAENGTDPSEDLKRKLKPLWGSGPREVRWPLFMLLGRAI